MPLVIRGFEAKPCEECGTTAIHHGLEKFTLGVNAAAARLFRPFEFSVRFLSPLLDRTVDMAGAHIASALAKMGLALEVDQMDPGSTETTMALWREAEKRGIKMREVRLLGLARNLFIASYNGRSFVFQGLPRRPHWQRSILWIDDKSEMKKRFLRAGFPVAKGGTAGTEKQALKIFRSLAQPAVTKPHEGSSGRHVTARIDSEEKLIAGFRKAKLVSPLVVVEEELSGPVYRATVIDGKLAGVLRRDAPMVIGDGISTIRELVRKENENPLRRGPVFSKINPENAYSQSELKRQNLALDSVLPQGQPAYFHFKVNWDLGAVSRDATPETHLENKKLFEKIGIYLGSDIVGLDFIIPDIGRPWQEQERCGVIECNSLPHLGNHHFPYSGQVQNVAGAVWDMVFPDSASKN